MPRAPRTSNPGTAIIWFRSDLRVADNPALAAACRSADRVIALFIATPGQWKVHDWGDPRATFVRVSLDTLADALRTRNIPLLFRTCPRFNAVPKIVLDIADQHHASAVFANRELEINETRRDEAVQVRLAKSDIELRLLDDQTILPPGTVRTGKDTPYTVFTPFKKKFIECLNERLADGYRAAITPLGKPRAQEPTGVSADTIPEMFDGFTRHEASAEHWAEGETNARRTLTRFISDDIDAYDQLRDIPSRDATSRLSPHLAAGAISLRQCFAAALDTTQGARILDDPMAKGGAPTWISELIWREFNRHLLHAFPRLSMHRAFRTETDSIPWSDNDEHFNAWCEARTGIPIIDAAMRQLVQTGWMHNRLRMVVAMFLTKNLLIDWRKGERFFMHHLVDADLANNNAGWQWSASTGTDAAPYFRIFNPISQSRKFDPQGSFIRQFIPELADLDDKDIHDPSEIPSLLRASIDYPEPIVDLKYSRAHAIEVFKKVLSA